QGLGLHRLTAIHQEHGQGVHEGHGAAIALQLLPALLFGFFGTALLAQLFDARQGRGGGGGERHAPTIGANGAWNALYGAESVALFWRATETGHLKRNFIAHYGGG